MTFNEGMRIDTSTTSTGGGGGGRRIAVGGGIGGVLVVVGALLLGVDPGTVTPQQQGLDPGGAAPEGFDLSQCRTGGDGTRLAERAAVATGNPPGAVPE